VKEILKRAVNYLAGSDSLRLYLQCKTCSSRVQFLGRPIAVTPPELWIM
jgi:DNA-directed RNA polymerase subunit RPC12/RpoP